MTIAYLGRKGQITIPKAARRAFDLQESDGLLVTVEGDRIVLRPVRRKRSLSAFKGVFAGRVPFQGHEAERQAMEEGVAEEVQASMGRRRNGA